MGKSILAFIILYFIAVLPACFTAASAEGSEAGVTNTGAETPGSRLTLGGAVEIALQRNAGLNAADAAATASRWDLQRARAGFLPAGAFTSSVTRVDPGTFDRANQALSGMELMFEQLGIPPGTIEIEPFLFEDTYSSAISVSQQFPLNLNLLADLRLSGALNRTSRYGYTAERASVVFETRVAFFQVLLARDLVDVAQRGLESAKKQLRVSTERESLGYISRSERLRWDVEVAKAESDMAEAKNGELLARMVLNQLLDFDLCEPVDAVPLEVSDFEYALALAAEEPETLVEKAAASSPAVLLQKSANEGAAAARLYALSALTPSLHFQGSWGWYANETLALDDEEIWSVTAVLNVPVFDLVGGFADYRKACAEKLQSDYETRAVVENLRMAVFAACFELERAEKSRKHLETAARHAEETYRDMEARYTEGHIAEFDLVDMQAVLSSARAGAAAAKYDYFTALAALEQLLPADAD